MTKNIYISNIYTSHMFQLPNNNCKHTACFSERRPSTARIHGILRASLLDNFDCICRI